jgi:predicted RNA-binding protein YlqC (UPF0109 family)
MNDIETYKTTEEKIKGANVDPDVYREEIRLLIEHVVRLLVDQPDTVTVQTYIGPKTTVFRVSCAKENLGQVIGSQGKTIMGLRSIVHSMTARIGIRSIIEIPV